MESRLNGTILQIGMLVFSLFFFIIASQQARDIPRKEYAQKLEIIAPAYIQTLMAFGDRYLASNIAVSRASALASYLVKDKNTYYVQGLLQEQAAILNPRQEDNYYIAAAILSWEEQTEAAQKVLKLATDARYWDAMPPFLLGFNEYYFYDNPTRGAELLEIAAERTEDINKRTFKRVASKWYTSQSDPSVAIGILNAMKQSSEDDEFRSYLDARIVQVEGLAEIDEAIKNYINIIGVSPTDINFLVRMGVLEKIPHDPFGKGFIIDNGKAKVKK